MASVSIIITAHNYAKFLPQALDSALQQTAPGVEVVVVNDGSKDHTCEVLSHYKDHPALKVVHLDGVGLAGAANRGIEASTGDYIVRLDADDWFDENLVVVLAGYLDSHPTVGMVFCDYHTTDIHGEIIDTVRRSKVNDEVKLLDRPCLAAGAMYRRQCWQAIGGYNEQLRYQEDYDFWIKFIEKFTVRNVSLPLMYYRQHGRSMSRNWSGRMDARRQIKDRFVREHRDRYAKRILAVVPARADQLAGGVLPLLPLGGQTLLERAVSKLTAVDLIDRVVVSTENPDIAACAEQAGADVPFLRSVRFNNPAYAFEAVLQDLLGWLDTMQDYRPDVVLILHPHSPFITTQHITEAIDSMLLYETDSVVSVVEDLSYHWRVGENGLAPVGYQKRVIRQEKDLIFKEAGGLYVVQPHFLLSGRDLLGNRIGHIEMAPHEVLRIQSPYEYWLAEQIQHRTDAGGTRW